jgi:hypothetical protein
MTRDDFVDFIYALALTAFAAALLMSSHAFGA